MKTPVVLNGIRYLITLTDEGHVDFIQRIRADGKGQHLTRGSKMWNRVVDKAAAE